MIDYRNWLRADGAKINLKISLTLTQLSGAFALAHPQSPSRGCG